MGSAIRRDDVARFFPALHVIVGIVAAVSSKNEFAIVPHFANHAASVREKAALMFLVPLLVREHHYRNVLIQIVRFPQRMPQDNYRTKLRADHFPR